MTAAMAQMDLLDLLVDPEPAAREQTLAEITVEVVGTWLGPHALNRVVRSLGTKNIDHVRHDFTAQHEGGSGGPGYLLKNTRTGIDVVEWFGAEPFRVTWNQLFAVVRQHTTPELAEALGAVCNGFAGGCTPEQWAAADAILPRRADTC